AFDLVVVRTSVENLGVQVGAAVDDEAVEEVVQEFGLQVADETEARGRIVDQGGTSAEVDGDHGESLVHGHNEVAGAVDAFAVTEGLGEELPQGDADVFDGMVLV